MAHQFDAANSKITATVTAVDTGDWTVAAWVYVDSAGESSIGSIFTVETSGAAAVQVIRFNASTRVLRATQARASVFCEAITTNTLPLSAWSFVVVTFDGTNFVVKVFIGDLTTPMVEAAYSSQPTGSGARTTSGTVAVIGNNSAQSRTWGGRIGPIAFDVRIWAVAEMESMRRTGNPPLWTGATASDKLRGWWPLVGDGNDYSGRGRDGTLTTVTQIDGPPLVGATRRRRRLKAVYAT